MLTLSAATRPHPELGNVSAWVQLNGWPYDLAEETAAVTRPQSSRAERALRMRLTMARHHGA